MITKVRAQQIIIDIPRTDSEPWIRVVVQRVELDDNHVEINVVDRWDSFNKRLSQVALEINKYTEVIPVIIGEISLYGLSDGIKEAVTSWLVENYNGILSDNGEVIIQ